MPKPGIPDLTKGEGPDAAKTLGKWYLHCGRTSGWLYEDEAGSSYMARQILITDVPADSSVRNELKVGDVILGVNGKYFSSHAVYEFRETSKPARAQGKTFEVILWRKSWGKEKRVKLNPCFQVGKGAGKLLQEYWKGVTGKGVAGLLHHPRFPYQPDSTKMIRSFESQGKGGADFGIRIRGLLHPPITRSYTFWIAGNADAQLWLSTDHLPANKMKIAEITAPSRRREQHQFESQNSLLVELEAGKRYYIEALMKGDQGTGRISVSWWPAGYPKSVISGQYLSPPVLSKFPFIPAGKKTLRMLIAVGKGKKLIGGDGSADLLCWDTRTRAGKVIKLPSALKCAALSPDGTLLALGLNSRQVLTCSTKDVSSLRKTVSELVGIPRAMSYSADGKNLVVAATNKKIEIWDRKGKRLNQCSVPSLACAVAVSHNGETIACGLVNGDILLLRASDLRLKKTLTGHQFAVRTLDFSTDGRSLLSGSDDMTLRLWKTSGQYVHSFIGHFSTITGSAFLPGDKAISSSRDGTVRIWSLKTGKELKKVEVSKQGLTCMAICSREWKVATPACDGLIYIIDDADLKKHTTRGEAPAMQDSAIRELRPLRP